MKRELGEKGRSTIQTESEEKQNPKEINRVTSPVVNFEARKTEILRLVH